MGSERKNSARSNRRAIALYANVFAITDKHLRVDAQEPIRAEIVTYRPNKELEIPVLYCTHELIWEFV